MGERGLKKFEIDMYTPLYSKWITNKNYCIAQETLLKVT